MSRLVQRLVLQDTRRTRTRQREGRGRERAGTEPVNDDWTEKRRIGPDRSSFLGSIWEWFSCAFHSEKLLEAESYYTEERLATPELQSRGSPSGVHTVHSSKLKVLHRTFKGSSRETEEPLKELLLLFVCFFK